MSTAPPPEHPDTDLDALVERAAGLLDGRDRALLGVVGAPGAGKSTFADALVDRLPEALAAVVVPMDGFHLADAQLDRLGLRDRKGAPETFDPAGLAALLDRIGSAAGEEVFVPGFERDLEQPIAAALVVPADARLVVVEGNYLLLDDGAWPRVRRALDEVWFLDVPGPTRHSRLVDRHVRFGKDPERAREWVDRVDTPNGDRVEATRANADLVLRG